MLQQLSDAANQLVKQSIPVHDSIMTREQINSIMPEDRGPLDLTRRIDDLEAEVSALKMKLEVLDNRPSK